MRMRTLSLTVLSLIALSLTPLLVQAGSFAARNIRSYVYVGTKQPTFLYDLGGDIGDIEGLQAVLAGMDQDKAMRFLKATFARGSLMGPFSTTKTSDAAKADYTIRGRTTSIVAINNHGVAVCAAFKAAGQEYDDIENVTTPVFGSQDVWIKTGGKSEILRKLTAGKRSGGSCTVCSDKPNGAPVCPITKPLSAKDNKLAYDKGCVIRKEECSKRETMQARAYQFELAEIKGK